MTDSATGLDRSAAVTRSLLGWGVVAGPFYVVVGLVLAMTRPGFNLGRHALSLLTLGDLGWLQRGNLALTGLMVLAAALGILRAIRNGRGLAIGVLTAVDGVALILSAIFVPDPVAGFPLGAQGGVVTSSGILHLVFGALGFVAIAAASVAHGVWSRSIGDARAATVSFILGAIVVLGFFCGAALATSSVGIPLLWLAVVAQFAWLALASAQIYRWSPHPVRSLRR